MNPRPSALKALFLERASPLASVQVAQVWSTLPDPIFGPFDRQLFTQTPAPALVVLGKARPCRCWIRLSRSVFALHTACVFFVKDLFDLSACPRSCGQTRITMAVVVGAMQWWFTRKRLPMAVLCRLHYQVSE